MVPGGAVLPPVQGVSYIAFTDPSGGSQDSFTLALAHQEGEGAVLDLVLERRPPFSPMVVNEDSIVSSRKRVIAFIEGTGIHRRVSHPGFQFFLERQRGGPSRISHPSSRISILQRR